MAKQESKGRWSRKLVLQHKRRGQTTTNLGLERPTLAFVFSLIAGLFVITGAALMAGFSSTAQYYGGMMGGYGGMMNGYYGMMQGFGFGGGWLYAMMAIGIISGIIILMAAIMIYNQPSEASTWGALILAFSVVSLLGMGGFFIGSVVGIVGGILALTFRTR